MAMQDSIELGRRVAILSPLRLLAKEETEEKYSPYVMRRWPQTSASPSGFAAAAAASACTTVGWLTPPFGRRGRDRSPRCASRLRADLTALRAPSRQSPARNR